MSGFLDLPFTAYLPITHRHMSVLLEGRGYFSDFLPTTQTHTHGVSTDAIHVYDCDSKIHLKPILVKQTSQSRQRPTKHLHRIYFCSQAPPTWTSNATWLLIRDTIGWLIRSKSIGPTIVINILYFFDKVCSLAREIQISIGELWAQIWRTEGYLTVTARICPCFPPKLMSHVVYLSLGPTVHVPIRCWCLSSVIDL